MTDTINRQEAIESVTDEIINVFDVSLSEAYDVAENALNKLPPAQPKTGHWILVKGSNGKDYHKCSNCLHTQDITGVKNYCALCGADMMEENNESD